VVKVNKTALRLILVVALISGIALAVVYRDVFNAGALEQDIAQHGAAGPAVFILIYIIATVFFLPGSVITLAGGALFGPVWGTFYNLTGAALGATIAFLIARYVGSDWVEQKAAGRLKQLKDGVEKEGWRFVAFVRLVPLFPFNLLNYALGLTKIRLIHYFVASYICMLPAAIAYTYLGYAGHEAIAGGEGLVQKGLLALALLAAVAFLPRLIGHFRRGPRLSVENLRQQLDSHGDMLLLDVRSAEDYIGGQSHISGATNIPLEALRSNLGDIGEYQGKPVAIICRTDRRSDKAAQLLAQEGFADVHVVAGGMTDWIQHGYPIEQTGNPGD